MNERTHARSKLLFLSVRSFGKFIIGACTENSSRAIKVANFQRMLCERNGISIYVCSVPNWIEPNQINLLIFTKLGKSLALPSWTQKINANQNIYCERTEQLTSNKAPTSQPIVLTNIYQTIFHFLRQNWNLDSLWLNADDTTVTMENTRKKRDKMFAFDHE